MLGPFTNKQSELLETKAGKTITKKDIKDYQQLYREFGDSWRISQAESLFDYAAGASTATYQKKDFPDPNPPKLDPSKEASARETCLRAGVPERAFAGCILDVAITGDAGFATTTAAAMRPLASPPLSHEKMAATRDDSNTQAFPLKIGDHVAVDKPNKGAGRLEMAGAIDQYTFTAQAGTVVYFKTEGSCTNDSIVWDLYDPTKTLITGKPVCYDLGRQELKQAGTYTIKVFGRETATGDYGFALSLDRK